MTTTETTTSQPATASYTERKREKRDLLPLWRITGKFIIETPLRLGTGYDENAKADGQDIFVASVARDFEGKPYIPSSSLKGALRALAKRYYLPGYFDKSDPSALENAGPIERRNLFDDLIETLFGKMDQGKGDTAPASVEFCNAYLSKRVDDSSLPDWNKDKQTAQVSHSVRNRDYWTTEEGLLFHEQLVPPGCEFEFECTTQRLKPEQVQVLRDLLSAVGKSDSPFRLGGGKSADHGRVTWAPDNKGVKTLSDTQLGTFWNKVKGGNGNHIDMWESAADPSDLRVSTLAPKPNAQLVLNDLTLNFHTPFLVYRRNPKKDDEELSLEQRKNEPNGIPRKNHKGEGVLPSSSLHGALRSQAERILRTVGIECKPAYKLNAVHTMKEENGVKDLDLAALLFGAPGWRSLLTCTDFIVTKGSLMDPPMTMTAIDRLTGGGKKGALFSIQVYDCPTLTGTLRLDRHRLEKLDLIKQNQLLGLLAHVLRDLDEGDIPLGYGAAKGYGACTSFTVNGIAVINSSVAKLEAEVEMLFPTPKSNGALSRFSQAIGAFATAAAGSTNGESLTPVSGTPVKIPDAVPNNAENLFHNPYAFLPFGTPDEKDWSEHASIPTSHHSHKQYAADALHGRLVCRLKTLTPIFIGAGDWNPPPAKNGERSQTNDQPKRKDNFRLAGHIALPATSLRGMLSSLHESITRSALRVMEERTYSVRKDFKGNSGVEEFRPLSAIGRVHVYKDAKGKDSVEIEPLTLPTLMHSDLIPNNTVYKLPEEYQTNCFPLLSKVWHKVLLESSWLNTVDGSDYKTSQDVGPAGEPSFSDENSGRYWYLPLNSLRWYKNGSFSPSNSFREKIIDRTPEPDPRRPAPVGVVAERQYSYFLIGQKPTGSCYPISEQEYSADFPKPERQYSDYVRGLLRVMSYVTLDASGKPVNRLPDTCKYGLFIPFPDPAVGAAPKLLRCSDACTERFAQLAQERFDSKKITNKDDKYLRLPFSPVNTPWRDFDKVLTPSEGDLVYFKLNNEGTEIDEISYSSIWRARVEHTLNGEIKSYDARQALPDKQPIAPMRGDTRPEDTRTLVSPSELLFGFVQDMGEKYEKLSNREKSKNPAKAFASKVRFGFGRFIGTGNPLLQENGHPAIVPLKILASPKPPSPPFYFKIKNKVNGVKEGAYIAKSKLVKKPTDYVHKGRKVYLHAKGVQLNEDGMPAQLNEQGIVSTIVTEAKPPWQTFQETENVDQKARVTLIAPKQPFCFEIDFHNLNQNELESLCATLLPQENYRHKIGMGKPIGLGSVKVDVVGLFLVNRQERYRQTAKQFADDGRYAWAWRNQEKGQEFPTPPPAHLIRERNAHALEQGNWAQALANKHMQHLETEAPALYRAIVLTGDPDKVKYPVHYPQVAKVNLVAASIETENFNWFVDNDKNAKDFLKDFTDTSDSLTTFKRRDITKRKL